jgi:DNA-binding winged helix-turn-helix (wHTH) protein
MELQPILPKQQRDPMRQDGSRMIGRRTRPAAADATFEFGRFRVLLRQRQLLADGVPVELGARAFDLLMVLIEADGRLVTKSDLLALVSTGVFVDETNLKVQVFALRKALGEDRDLIRTEVGRGYRFTAATSSIAAVPENPRPMRRRRRSGRRVCSERTSWLTPDNWCASRLSWSRRSTCSPRIG